MIKKLFYTLALMAMATSFAACGDDEKKDEPSLPTYYSHRINVKTGMKGALVHQCEIDAKFAVYTDGHMDIMLQGVKFAEKMPAVDFTIGDVKYKTESEKVWTVSGSAPVGTAGYSISGLTGVIDLATGIVSVKFKVNDMYDVLLLTNANYSKLSSGSDYEKTTETFFDFNFFAVQNKDKVYSGNIGIHNIAFVPQMPKLKHIIVPLEKATVTPTATGYTYEGTDIIPLFVVDGAETPMKERPVTNLKGETNFAEGTFSIEFDCYGLHYTNSGKLFR
ncbi:MAG: hypothetical protein Q4B68_01605 [Bacteroidales bacterium]|nr:hypothetical protein [Bacteroidales bacterium]